MMRKQVIHIDASCVSLNQCKSSRALNSNLQNGYQSQKSRRALCPHCIVQSICPMHHPRLLRTRRRPACVPYSRLNSSSSPWSKASQLAAIRKPLIRSMSMRYQSHSPALSAAVSGISGSLDCGGSRETFSAALSSFSTIAHVVSTACSGTGAGSPSGVATPEASSVDGSESGTSNGVSESPELAVDWPAPDI